MSEILHEDEPKWAGTKQRHDLKRCPFCGTQAIQQVKLWRTENRYSYRILCGNPFCDLDCATKAHHSLQDAEETWQTRA